MPGRCATEDYVTSLQRRVGRGAWPWKPGARVPSLRDRGPSGGCLKRLVPVDVVVEQPGHRLHRLRTRCVLEDERQHEVADDSARSPWRLGATEASAVLNHSLHPRPSNSFIPGESVLDIRDL